MFWSFETGAVWLGFMGVIGSGLSGSGVSRVWGLGFRVEGLELRV